MPSKKDSKKLKSIESEIEVRHLLNQAIDTQAEGLFSFKDNTQVFKAKLTPDSDSKDSLIFRLSGSEPPPELENSQESQIILFLPNQVLVGFPTRVESETKDRLKVLSPKRIYQIERRGYSRLVLPRGYDLLITVRRPGIQREYEQRKLIDLGAGGLGFFVDGAEICPYEKETKIPKILLRLNHREFQFAGKVTHLSDYTSSDGASGTKVGVQFTRIADKDRDFISAYILRKTLR